MEPRHIVEPQGGAPLVTWSSETSSLLPTPNRISKANCCKEHEEYFKNEESFKHGKYFKHERHFSDEDTLVIPILDHNILDKDSIVSSFESNSDATEDKPKIPDGGYGWVIVVASLILSMIADGVSFSFGLLYIEFLHEFGASKSSTAWIGSLFLSVPLLTGPIMSAFVDRYGCRKMTMVGGLLSGLGFITSSFANSIGVMYFTFGILAGCGLGLCYVTAVVSIAYWFDKKRNFAVGLGACGTGIGTFVYAPMTQYFIGEYGWRGTTLLLAGTFLNMCVCGALMRDPDWMIQQNNKTPSCTIVEPLPNIEDIRKLLKSNQNNQYQLQSVVTSLDSKDFNRSDVNIPTFVKQHEKVPFEVLEQLSSNKRLYNVILENYPSLLSCRSVSDKGLNKIPEDANCIKARVPVTFSMKVKKNEVKVEKNEMKVEKNEMKLDKNEMKLDKNEMKLDRNEKKFDNNETKLDKNELNLDKTEFKLDKSEKRRDHITHQFSLPEKPLHEPLLLRKTSLHQPVREDSLTWYKKHFNQPNYNRFMRIKLHRNSVMYRGAMMNIGKYRLRASSCPNIYRNSMTTLAREHQEKWYSELLGIVKTSLDFSMFLETHFFLLSLSTMLLFIWFIIPYFYLAEHLTRHSYTESEASFVLSVIGITNSIGMVVLGWAGDQPWMNTTKTLAASLILCGFSCIAILFSTNNFILLCVSSGFFGLFFASSFVFTPVILVDLVPLDKFTVAYGLMLLCQGIGNLIGPPLAGLLFDLTKSWEQSFIQAGIWIVVSGVLLTFIPFTKNGRIFSI